MAHALVRLGLALSVVLATASLGRTQARPLLQPFSADLRQTVVEQALKSPLLADFAKAGRVRALSVVPEEVDKDGTPRIVAAATFVNYGTGRAVRALIAIGTRQVETVQPLTGRPQSSEDERREAEEILRRDAEVGPMLKSGARLQGGFIVDAPAGQPAIGRYLEYHVASPDGRAFVAEAIVDLARAQTVAIRRAAAQGGAR